MALTSKEAFPVDLNELRYEISIKVMKNSTETQIKFGNSNVEYHPTFQEVIGVLEISKAVFIRQHKEHVDECAKTQRPPEPKI